MKGGEIMANVIFLGQPGFFARKKKRRKYILLTKKPEANKYKITENKPQTATS